MYRWVCTVGRQQELRGYVKLDRSRYISIPEGEGQFVPVIWRVHGDSLTVIQSLATLSLSLSPRFYSIEADLSFCLFVFPSVFLSRPFLSSPFTGATFFSSSLVFPFDQGMSVFVGTLLLGQSLVSRHWGSGNPDRVTTASTVHGFWTGMFRSPGDVTSRKGIRLRTWRS